MRRPLRLLLTLLAAALVALVLGTVLPRPLFDPATGSEPPARRILVLSSQIHTDIAVPIDARTLADFPFLRDAGLPVDHPDARWILFGWGGRAFYLQTPTWGDLKPLPLFKALTIDASVMHVEILGAIAEPWPGLLGFDIPESKHRDMLAFIRASFAESGTGPLHIAGAHYGKTDAFFEATGSFNALLGCNTWTASALRRAGLQTGWWNPLPATLSYSLALHN
jgi:uncharacterized protein (TIGR02117 family)